MAGAPLTDYGCRLGMSCWQQRGLSCPYSRAGPRVDAIANDCWVEAITIDGEYLFEVQDKAGHVEDAIIVVRDGGPEGGSP